MSLVVTFFFAGLLLAEPHKYKSDCVDGWSWIGDKGAYGDTRTFSVYSNPNACLLYIAVDDRADCYDVKRDNDGYYYILLRGEWTKMY